MNFAGLCPVCDANISSKEQLEESEILHCPDCMSMLVVDSIHNNTIGLDEAPQIEEDWGE